MKPKVRGFICVSAHPDGCAAHVAEQIAYVRAQGKIENGPKKVLVIGASTGYGLSSRIAAAFGAQADTVGVFFERPCDKGRPASTGWYNSVAFEKAAKAAGLKAFSINGDAFSDEIKRKTLDLVRAELGQIDLLVYSLASPRRTDPKTGEVYKSVLKTKDAPFTAKSVDTDKAQVVEVSIEPATPAEIAATVKVMGGEDWEIWAKMLKDEGLLAPGALSVAYSYIGPQITHPIYKEGSIGQAKKDVERAARAISESWKEIGGRALVSVNKALVTQASSAIPVVPLYISILYKVMKERGVHEGCIEQMFRLLKERLYTGGEIPTDAEGRVRIDDLELRPEIQEAVKAIWPKITTENLKELSDFEGYQKEFLKLFGFGFPQIDYAKETELERDFE